MGWFLLECYGISEDKLVEGEEGDAGEVQGG